MHITVWVRAMCGWLCVLLVGSLVAAAQSNQGSIAGNVLDPSGSAIPHAAVSARNRETGYTATVNASETGSFRLPAVPLGTYDISITAAGFRVTRYEGVLVQVATVTTLDASLPRRQFV